MNEIKDQIRMGFTELILFDLRDLRDLRIKTTCLVRFNGLNICNNMIIKKTECRIPFVNGIFNYYRTHALACCIG